MGNEEIETSLPSGVGVIGKHSDGGWKSRNLKSCQRRRVQALLA